VFLLFAVAASLTTASPASAALPWVSCSPAGFQCAKATVPLDRSGAIPGAFTIDATRKPAANGAVAKTAIVALAGGPGQAAVPFAQDFASIFAGALTDKDLLVFNQRGTGNSGLISCPAFNRSSGSQTSIVQDCSLQLGSKRAFYTTAQSVEDLEQLRVAGGYDKLIIYGVSYGTKVALAYAAAHPTAVQSLILDSVVTPEGPDALRRSSLAAVPRVIGTDLCGDNACAASGGNVLGDLQSVVDKLNSKSIKGTVYSGKGKGYTAKLSTNGLISVLSAGDLNPETRSELPGALRALLTGDKQPLLRLSARAAGLDNASSIGSAASLLSGLSPSASTETADPTVATAASDASDAALYYATICEEVTTFPWTRGAPVTQRATEAVNAVKAFPAGTFGIFGNSTAVALGGLPETCLGWDVASPAPAATPALPNVPVLVLDGGGDLRTPLEDAQNVAARFPQATFVPIPDTGHSVVTAEAGTCAKTAVTTFLAGGAVGQCGASAPEYPPAATPPRTLGSVAAPASLKGKPGRTLNALAASIVDGRRQVIGEAIETGSLPSAVGGLRSGSVKVASSKKLVFRSYEFIRGVRISGDYKPAGTSKFRITGSAASSGTVTISKSGRAKGRLGGKKFSIAPKAASASLKTDLVSLDQAVALGKREQLVQ
jgi:pimeloyl-ACP methyl ester carboxylesterase